MATPTLSVDRPTGRGVEREKKKISIGSKALVGFGSHVGGTIGNDATVRENYSVQISAPKLDPFRQCVERVLLFCHMANVH